MKLHPLSPRAFVAGLILTVASCFFSAWACSPAQQAAEERALIQAAPAVERAVCVVIRAVLHDGTSTEICATADELAPLVPQLLADRASSPATTVAATSQAMTAFALPAPRHRVRSRRCSPPAVPPSTLDASDDARTLAIGFDNGHPEAGATDGAR